MPIGTRPSGILRLWRLMPRLDDTLIQQAVITAMKEPSSYDLRDLQKYFREMKLPLLGLDKTIWGWPKVNSSTHHPHAPDLVTLRPRAEQDSFSKWVVEKALKRFFRYSKRRLERSRVNGMKGYDDEKFLQITYLITSIIASLIPSISIITLYYIKSTIARLGMLAVFNLLISVCLTAFTTARRADIFAITAA
jgi:hypothetical protein